MLTAEEQYHRKVLAMHGNSLMHIRMSIPLLTTNCLRIVAVCRLLIRVNLELNHSWETNGWESN